MRLKSLLLLVWLVLFTIVLIVTNYNSLFSDEGVETNSSHSTNVLPDSHTLQSPSTVTKGVDVSESDVILNGKVGEHSAAVLESENAKLRVCVDDEARLSLFLPDPVGNIRANIFGSGTLQYELTTQARCDVSLRVYYRDRGWKSRDRYYSKFDFDVKDPRILWVLAEELCNRPSPRFHLNIYHDARDEHPHVDLPLGPHFAFKYVSESEAFEVPPSQRRYWFNLVVSLSTSDIRTKLLKASLQWRVTANKCAFIWSTKKWKNDYWRSNETQQEELDCPNAGNSNSNVHLNPHRYRDVLMKSTFTLSPPGHNLQCFRIFEAVEVGSIPIVVAAPEGQGCLRTLDFFTNSPFIVVDTIDKAFSEMKRLSQNPSSLDSLARQLRGWYDAFIRKSVQTVEHELMTLNQSSPTKSLLSSYLRPKRVARKQDVRVPLVTYGGQCEGHTIASWLNKIGIRAIHEGAKDGFVSVSWYYAAVGASLDLGIPKHIDVDKRDGRGIDFSKIIHIVREPLAHIARLEESLCEGQLQMDKTCDEFSLEFAEKHYPKISTNGVTRQVRVARYWLYWNQLAGRFADARFKVEHLDEAAFLKAIGHSTWTPATPLSSMIVASEHSKWTWRTLADSVGDSLARAIYEQALSYGYNYTEVAF